MNHTAIECIQGDSTWWACRLGAVTGSRVADAISYLKRKSGEKDKGESSKARDNLLVELVFEILTTKPSPHFVSQWMEEGREKEPIARTEYEIANDVYVEQVGFIFHPTIKMAGCSPDGLIGKDGGVEFKCPKYSTHLRYQWAGVIPKDYRDQMMWCIACSEREWWDFGSYNDLVPRKYQNFWPARMYRDDKRIAEMESEVIRFNEEVQEAILKLDPEYITDKLRESLPGPGELGITEQDIATKI